LPGKKAESLEELKNTYFIYGDEELMVSKSLARLRGLMEQETDAELSLVEIDASDAGAVGILDAAETIPMLSSRRLVVVRNADRLSKRDQEVLSSYLDNPNPLSTIVLVAKIPQGSEEKSRYSLKKVEGSILFKKAGAVGQVMKYSLGKRGRRQKITDWVSEAFANRGKKVDGEARDLLLGMVGSELRELEDAVERVCLYCADRDRVSVQDVRNVVVPSAELGIFELIDSVADRRRDLSLYQLNRLIRQGESQQRIFNLLLRQFRLIARAKALGRDQDFSQIAPILGVPPFVAGKCLRQSKRFSPERLRSAFGEFKKAQIQLHSSGYLPERDYQSTILETLITRIIG
jgi:DNA polymerase III subunit delta